MIVSTFFSGGTRGMKDDKVTIFPKKREGLGAEPGPGE
jgi:hypothetical protein